MLAIWSKTTDDIMYGGAINNCHGPRASMKEQHAKTNDQ